MVYVYINMPLRKSGKTHVKHLFTVMTVTRRSRTQTGKTQFLGLSIHPCSPTYPLQGLGRAGSYPTCHRIHPRWVASLSPG